MTEQMKCIEFFQLKSGAVIIEIIKCSAEFFDVPFMETTTDGPDTSGEPDEETEIWIQLPEGNVNIFPDRKGQPFIHSAPYPQLSLQFTPDTPKLEGATETFSLFCREIKRAVDGQEIIPKPEK